MNYQEKKKIADAYLINKTGLGWDDFPDINSLHNANTREEIISLCNERMSEEGREMGEMGESDNEFLFEDED